MINMLEGIIDAKITIVKIDMEVNGEAIQEYKKDLEECKYVSDYMKNVYEKLLAKAEATQEAKKQHLSDLEKIREAL